MLHDHERTQSKLKEDLGPLVYQALRDKDVIEIMLNEDGVLWVDTYSGMRKYGSLAAEAAKNLINTISSVAGVSTTRESPNLGGEIWVMVDSDIRLFRFQGLIPPIVSSPVFSIRKPAMRVIPLAEYFDQGVINKEQLDCLQKAIREKTSILVIGGTQSGKTTLCNALLDEMALAYPNDRLAIIEDTIELQCNVANKIQLRTSDNRTMDDLLKYCMRLRPDRIIVGEVRGKEAYSLIKAWNTGHPGGLSTIHANSAQSGLLRLEQLISEAGIPVDRRGIIEAVNMLVFIEKASGSKAGRKVKEILQVS